MMHESARETTGELSKARGPGGPWRWALVVVYMAAIFLSSSRSDASIPGGVSDKVAHGLAYSGLSGLIVWAVVEGDWRRIRLRTVLLAVVPAVAYGLADEIHQLFVPRRSFEWFDLVADAAGAFTAAFAAWAWGILLRRSTRVDGVRNPLQGAFGRTRKQR